ncbi:hypothetical protein DXT63_11835 [Thermoanaerobacteraceae bacterium SP2]|nr:hypothetical protein DXT63_11835 [Thermoanaerobacteraceae bacterium SP2]
MSTRKRIVWLIFAIYIMVLGYLAFGSFNGFTTIDLVAVGLKAPHYGYGTYYGPGMSGGIPDFRKREKMYGTHLIGYGPNYGGFLAYSVGGAVIAYLLQGGETTKKQQ